MAITYNKQLTAGTPENVNDVMANFNQIATDEEYAFSTYKDLVDRAGYLIGGSGAATYVIGPSNGLSASMPTATFQLAGHAFKLDPADRTAGSRTTKYRVVAETQNNSTAPAVNFTFGLYPVTFAGGSATTIGLTPGTVNPGSTAAINAPGASSGTAANSGDFNAPAAGWYVLGVVTSGTTAANSFVICRAVVQARQV